MNYEQAIIVVALFALIWFGVVIFLLKTDAGDGKRKNIAGIMSFGFFWPLFKNDAQRAMTSREKIGWTVVIMLMAVGLIYSVVSGTGKY
jgi:uncharacterized membrane protein